MDQQPTDTAEQASTFNLRIVSAFVILGGGLLGSVPCVFWKSLRGENHTAPRLLRAFAAGVILALALVHIVPDSHSDLEKVTDYPLAGVCVFGGLVVLALVEHSAHSLLQDKHSHGACHAVTDNVCDEEQPCGPAHIQTGNQRGLASAVVKYACCSGCGHDSPSSIGELRQPLLTSIHEATVMDTQHLHSCLRVSTNWMKSTVSEPQAATRNKVMAYIFELGCVFHSVLIGLALGVTVEGAEQVRALLIALTFHQALEGVGLGSVIAKAGFSAVRQLLMSVLFSVTAPVGVLVGVLIANTYDTESDLAIFTQGVLNGISGGMLLYVALIQLFAEEFSKQDLRQHTSLLLRLAMYVALLLGGASMCVLAAWA